MRSPRIHLLQVQVAGWFYKYEVGRMTAAARAAAEGNPDGELPLPPTITVQSACCAVITYAATDVAAEGSGSGDDPATEPEVVYVTSVEVSGSALQTIAGLIIVARRPQDLDEYFDDGKGHDSGTRHDFFDFLRYVVSACTPIFAGRDAWFGFTRFVGAADAGTAAPHGGA